MPCIVSGEQMLLIDPQQSPEKVNAMVELYDIPSLEELDEKVVLSALQGCLGFSKHTLKERRFNGTLMRFPLRETSSDLSENLYSRKKVTDLFDGFQTEISTIMLFLKNLESIELLKRDSDLDERLALVEILDENHTIRSSKDKFKKQLEDMVETQTFTEDIECSLEFTIKTTTKDETLHTTWNVINFVIGQSASVEFRELMKDKRLGYSPYVGLASCCSSQENGGHVFCFLPLPKEGSKLSGLPFHVNGFFALSKNRHHLKWVTDEQKGKEISDKSIVWNQKMLSEALPKAYELLLNNVVSLAKTKGSLENEVSSVYRMFLNLDHLTDDKWILFGKKALERMQNENILFCNQAGQWITIPDAVFVFHMWERTSLIYQILALKHWLPISKT